MAWQQKLKDEMKALGIAGTYFACWIAAMLLIKTLILAEYRITATNGTVILVGALVLSKVVIILEHVSPGGLGGRHFANRHVFPGRCRRAAPGERIRGAPRIRRIRSCRHANF